MKNNFVLLSALVAVVVLLSACTATSANQTSPEVSVAFTVHQDTTSLPTEAELLVREDVNPNSGQTELYYQSTAGPSCSNGMKLMVGNESFALPQSGEGYLPFTFSSFAEKASTIKVICGTKTYNHFSATNTADEKNGALLRFYVPAKDE